MEPSKEISVSVTPREDPSEGSMSSVQNSEHQHPHRSRYQKVYNSFGFSNAYNFPLYIFCVGALFAFSLSRLETFDYDHTFKNKVARPGLWWALKQHRASNIGMIMHLVGAIPAGILVTFQFTPIIRHKFLLFHRINGYIIMLLLLVSNAGCAILLRRPMGTDVPWQTVISMLIIFTTFSAAMAIWNIKRLQIDQHRAWMLRCMFVLATAITGRITGLAAAYFITRIGGWYAVYPCTMIDFTNRQYGINGILESKYPSCLASNGTLDGNVVVRAQLNPTAPEETGAVYAMLSGPAVWLALIFHVVGLEIYLHLTPREAKRLRQVSYERQVAAGYRNPGYSGSSVERWGDADKWQPEHRMAESMKA